jgi:hypothetical protein
VSPPNDPHEREADRVAEHLGQSPAGAGALAQLSSRSADTARAGPSGGQPIEPPIRALMESQIDHDFSDVRVHTGEAAARSAEQLGAVAYTIGRDITFARGQYRPDTAPGRKLLAHELTHVVQQRGGEPAMIQRQPANQADALYAALARIRSIAVPFKTEEKVRQINEAVRGVDLTNPSNMDAVISTIGSTFGAESAEILAQFLGPLDRPAPTPQPYVPSAEEEARLRRQISPMQIQRRGPYGQYGPGVLIPVLVQPGRHLLPAVEAVGHAFSGAGAFVEGLLEGLSGSLSEQQREQLAVRLLQSTILNVVFPPVFLAGTAVGVVEDVVDAVKGIYHLITNFRDVVSGMVELVKALFSPESRAIGRAMGLEVGRDYGRRIAAMSSQNIFEFTFNLGRMIGPTILYTVLAFLGVPELIVSAIVARLLPILRTFLAQFPRLLRIVEAVAVRLTRAGQHASMRELEEDLSRAFARTFDQPGPAPRPAAGGVVTQAPELAAGFTAQHLGPLRRLLGKSLTHADVWDLGRLWAAAANPGEVAELTLENSRRLFDNHRGRFWRRVRQDPAASRLFTDAGFVFEGDATTAPFRRLSDGRVMQMTIDHIVERQSAPGRALDPNNLRVVSRLENTVMLRQLTAQGI